MTPDERFWFWIALMFGVIGMSVLGYSAWWAVR